jgi:hypothetical protein
MQNKPNFPDAQILVNCVLTMDYVNIRLRSRFKNKANQTQFKANSKPIKPNFNPNTPKTNPIKPNLLDAKFFNKSDKPLLLMSRNISVLFVDE